MIDRLWAGLAIRQCVAMGVDQFFLAPGSRCTPLTLAVAEQESINVVQHVDERGLAFATLGFGRATGRPGVFICTSGTAVANAFPAVIEAAMEGIPMLLFTADRPPELRDTGANQTIDQVHLFGDYPRWFFDLPCPTEAAQPDYVSSVVSRAIRETRAGPVHLNWMFREPFGLDPASPSMSVPEARQAPVVSTNRLPVDATQDDTSIELHAEGNVVMVAGGCRPDEARVVQELADQFDIPLVTDVTSGLRRLVADTAQDLPGPDTLIHFGGRLVSKKWHELVASWQPKQYLHVSPRDLPLNPLHVKQQRIVADIEQVRLKEIQNNHPEFNKLWSERVTSYQAAVTQLLGGEVSSTGERCTEPHVAFQLAVRLPSGHALFLGNSTPIRDFDRYAFWTTEKELLVGANRGASGIDGLMATAVGFAAGHQRPTTVVLGDLSCLHDLNSLILVKNSKVPISVVVINNQAGGIFDMLPIAARTDIFEQYFATPHPFGFRYAAEMFQLPYRVVETCEELQRAFQWMVDANESLLIEVKTERGRNQQMRQRISEQLTR